VRPPLKSKCYSIDGTARKFSGPPADPPRDNLRPGFLLPTEFTSAPGPGFRRTGRLPPCRRVGFRVSCRTCYRAFPELRDRRHSNPIPETLNALPLSPCWAAPTTGLLYHTAINGALCMDPSDNGKCSQCPTTNGSITRTVTRVLNVDR
jgi:hypothetical protein